MSSVELGFLDAQTWAFLDEFQILAVGVELRKNITLSSLNFLQGYKEMSNFIMSCALIYLRNYFQTFFKHNIGS